MESERVAVDNRPVYTSSRQQMDRINPVRESERQFVDQFLKEITDIEDINRRFEIQQSERNLETQIRTNPNLRQPSEAVNDVNLHYNLDHLQPSE